jgi:hypothetical protein
MRANYVKKERRIPDEDVKQLAARIVAESTKDRPKPKKD